MPPGQFVDLTAGSIFVCGVTIDGEMVCADSNYAEIYRVDTPRLPPVPLPGHEFVKVEAGSGGVCGLTNYGYLNCTWPFWYADHATWREWTPVGHGGFESLQQRGGAFDDVVVGGFIAGCGVDNGVVDCFGPTFQGVAPLAGPVEDFDFGANHICEIDALGQISCRYRPLYQTFHIATPDELTGEACPNTDVGNPFDPTGSVPWTPL